MSENPTGFPDLWLFDSTIPQDGVSQRLEYNSEYPVTGTSTFTEYLSDRGVVEDAAYLEKGELLLWLEGASTQDNMWTDEEVMASVNWFLDVNGKQSDEYVGFIGSVWVHEGFRRNHIGLRLKEQAMNHIQQKGVDVVYTWIESDAGRELAAETGFGPEVEHFGDVEEIWVCEIN